MKPIYMLVIDDEPQWQEMLSEDLSELGANIRVEVAASYQAAQRCLNARAYDLIIGDLKLAYQEGGHTDTSLGMQVLEDIGQHPLNKHSARLVVTGYPTPEYATQAFRQYVVHDFISKLAYDSEDFKKRARKAWRTATLNRPEHSLRNQYRFTLSFNQGYLVSSELVGPDRRSVYLAESQAPFDVQDLAWRADKLNVLLLEAGPSIWRDEVQAIGQAIYEALYRDRRMMNDLTAARALASAADVSLRLEFCGPVNGLGIPFELLRDEEEYLCFQHSITRRFAHMGSIWSSKPKPFHAFVRNLIATNQPLRTLIVGANTDGKIAGAEEEATTLKQILDERLEMLGIPHDKATCLTGANATRQRVREALTTGRYHIFHYAGHGRYEDQRPELSGLIFSDGCLTASDLSLLVRRSDLRKEFLSCCLGARTSDRVGRDDFHGLYDALVRADVPIVLGHRWSVSDASANTLAITYYKHLLRTWSPQQALANTRKTAATGRHGLNDEAWASPVLLMQNA